MSESSMHPSSPQQQHPQRGRAQNVTGDLVPRPGARVVLIEDTDRLLLFSRTIGTMDRALVQPGGGLRPGEHHQHAALRELRQDPG
jgi:8-oxo-dGTP pyrophosphatase MutT (NUDIX family)